MIIQGHKLRLRLVSEVGKGHGGFLNIVCLEINVLYRSFHFHLATLPLSAKLTVARLPHIKDANLLYKPLQLHTTLTLLNQQ